MRKYMTLLFCILTFLTHAQKTLSGDVIFSTADFNTKTAVADWLYKYDIVASMTSDSAMAQDKKQVSRLGKEWFCFQDKSDVWHAVYGNYDHGSFNQVFHFILDKTLNIKRISDRIDTLMLNTYSRALITANKKYAIFKDSLHNVKFNQYIKQNQDKTFSVWILPAFQKANYVIYGGEFIYTIDQTGTKVLKDNSYYQGRLRGFKVETKLKTIIIDYSKLENPTLGAIFFVWSYKKYFQNIYIECAHSKSTAIKDENDVYTWLHTEK